MLPPNWLTLMLGVLSAVGPISTDMYLPAFPAIEQTFGGRAGTAQITLATWFLGLAVGQITQGSLSDRFGRRTPLIAGTIVYTLASLGCALASDLSTLSVLRFLAAFGGSASMVIPRAIVRDLAEGIAAARMMSRLILVMGVAPILAPSLGGLLLSVGSWHIIFYVATLYGAICCGLVIFALPDTLPPARRIGLNPSRMIHRYADIAVERGFISHALVGGFGMFAMFAYLSSSPAVFIQHFGLRPGLYGALFGACAAGYILASQVNTMLIGRYGPDRVIRTAVRVFLVATTAQMVFALLHVPVWWAFSACILTSLSMMGLTMPNITVGALQRHAAHAGSASALMGTLQFCLGAISGIAAGLIANGTPMPMALLMLTGAVAANLADRGRPRIVPATSPAASVATRQAAIARASTSASAPGA